MQVFLIPIGADRYELYCEMPEDALATSDADEDAGLVKRTLARLRAMVARFEEERHRGEQPKRGFTARVFARFGRSIAETLAEQRLLWHLRRETAATAVHPADLDAPSADRIVRGLLRKDFERHRFWLAIDGILLALSALLTLLPGPNLIAYYFAFRVVGHFLSIRGARQALHRVEWSAEPSQALTDLRTLVGADPMTRRPRIDAIAAALGLEHLSRFFEQVTTSDA